MIKEVDVSGDGEVDFHEFLNMMAAKLKEEDPQEESMQAFRVFDKNSTGYIGHAELKHVLTHLGEDLTDDQIEEMIAEAAVEDPLRLNFEEFFEVFNGG